MIDNNQELTTKLLSLKENPGFTKKELMLITTMSNIKNPYRNLTVNDVARDLKIGINSAYELFKQDDFPSIEVGKTKTITLLAYLMWKLEKHK